MKYKPTSGTLLEIIACYMHLKPYTCTALSKNYPHRYKIDGSGVFCDSYSVIIILWGYGTICIHIKTKYTSSVQLEYAKYV